MKKVISCWFTTFNQLQKNKNRLQNDFTIRLAKGKMIKRDGLKVSNVYLDIGYYSSTTSSVTKFGIGQKGMVNFYRFNLLISSFIDV
jgi:hypothetical protein